MALIGYKVASTGFSPADQNEIQKLVELCGGIYTTMIRRDNNVLISQQEEHVTEKIEFASMWQIPIVRKDWLTLTYQDQMIHNFDMFEIQMNIDRKKF